MSDPGGATYTRDKLEGKDSPEMPTQDPMILSRIGELVEQERELRDRHRTKPLASSEKLQLEELETELDQCWDLLNQRRALREFGLDPKAAEVRDEDTVEGYQQ
jgi:hypothetical protein